MKALKQNNKNIASKLYKLKGAIQPSLFLMPYLVFFLVFFVFPFFMVFSLVSLNGIYLIPVKPNSLVSVIT